MATSHPHPFSLAVKATPLPGRELYSIPVSEFPIAKPQATAILAFISSLTDELRKSKQLATEVFLKVSECRHDGAGSQVAEHGREWQPRLGLGVWPDRPSPSRWTKDEMASTPPGEKPRNFMETVLYLGGSPQAKDDAWRAMFGAGSLIMALVSADGGPFLDKTKSVLQPALVNRPFKSFSLYVPLFSSKSLLAATQDQLALWCCGSEVYIRENPDENEIIICSTHSLARIFETLGGRMNNSQDQVWQFGN